MEDFPKKLMVLVLLLAFFGALFLEAPLIYKKVQNGGIPVLNFLIPPAGEQKHKTSDIRIYNGGNQSFVSDIKDYNSKSSRICVPALDGGSC